MTSALRNFFVMFFLFLIIFGVCGHFFATDILPELISAGSEKDDSSLNDENVSDSSLSDVDNSYVEEDKEENKEYENYTIAFFCLGIDEELVEIYMVHINDGYKTSTSASIPASSTAEIGGFTFEDLYRKYGTEYVISKLFYLTGYSIDDYACLKAIDRNGRGHSITDLSKRLGYNYRVNTAFEYPDPAYESYKDKLENDKLDNDEEPSAVSSDDSQEEKIPEEFFTVQPDNYALHGITNGLNNYTILFDSEYNPYAYTIYEDFFKRLIDNLSKSDVTSSDIVSVFKCFEDKTFSVDNYENTDLAKFMFKYKNQQVECNGEKISDWDNIRNTLKAKEKGSSEQ